MASVVVIASSTRSASAMMSAPSEMRCMSIPAKSIATKTMARVSGMAVAMTRPGLTPRLMKLTTRMMPTACQSEDMNSETAVSTVTAWSETRMGSMPSGSSALALSTTFVMFSPRDRMSPPSRMAMARPMAGVPLTRNKGCGGSE
jgi:hypothetical protein